MFLDVDGSDSTPPPPPEDDMPEPPVFEVDENFRVLPVTYPGCLPRLATGCNEGTVTDFDLATREYTAKPLAMFSRAWTKIPEDAAVCPGRDGTAEMNSQGGQRSSEATREISSSSRKTEKLTRELEQADVQLERERKKAKRAHSKIADGKRRAEKLLAAVQAEVSARPRRAHALE